MNAKSLYPVDRQRGLSARAWHPFESLQREVDRLLQEFSGSETRPGKVGPIPNIDVTETDKEIEVTAELPGLEEKDVQVSLADGVLTIRGEKKVETEQKEKSYRVIERSYGAFERSLELPAGVDPDKIAASMAKGVLKVVVPKPAPAQTRRIDVKAAA